VEPISKLLKEQGGQDVQVGDRNNHGHHHQLKTRIMMIKEDWKY
jgi:hypothetical protein